MDDDKMRIARQLDELEVLEGIHRKLYEAYNDCGLLVEWMQDEMKRAITTAQAVVRRRRDQAVVSVYTMGGFVEKDREVDATR